MLKQMLSLESLKAWVAGISPLFIASIVYVAQQIVGADDPSAVLVDKNVWIMAGATSVLAFFATYAARNKDFTYTGTNR